MSPWVVALDTSLTLAFLALIWVCLVLGSLSRKKPLPEYRECWLQLRQQGYGRFVMLRGVLACGGSIALTIGLLSFGSVYACGQTRPTSFTVPAGPSQPGSGAVPRASDTQASAWQPGAFGACLGATVLPALLIGAYYGDRLWRIREQWYQALETAGGEQA